MPKVLEKVFPVSYARTPRWLFAVGACLALGLPAPADPLPGRSAGRMRIEPPVRSDFAAKMAKVTVGRPDWEVRKLLGKPDDVRTCDELRATTSRTKEIWCYGTSGHLTFPTLGSVYIDTNNRVQYIFGVGGTPPDPKLVGEEGLRNLLRLIDEAPAVSGYHYNPRTVIRIVNRLQPLGKEKALAAIDEYLRVTGYLSDAPEGGLFLVLRVLFDVPADPGYMPRMGIGAPSPAEPGDRNLIPRFPIALVDDVPLLVVGGYFLAGAAQPVRDHVKYFRDNGRLRSRPLAPSSRPLDVLDHLPDALKKHFAEPDSGGYRADMLSDQLFRLVYSVHRKKGLAISENGVRYAGYARRGPVWKEERATLAEFSDAGLRGDSGGGRWRGRSGVKLPAGQAVRAELTLGKQVMTSPIYEP
jgi:hypothetical protein